MQSHGAKSHLLPARGPGWDGAGAAIALTVSRPVSWQPSVCSHCRYHTDPCHLVFTGEGRHLGAGPVSRTQSSSWAVLQCSETRAAPAQVGRLCGWLQSVTAFRCMLCRLQVRLSVGPPLAFGAGFLCWPLGLGLCCGGRWGYPVQYSAAPLACSTAPICDDKKCLQMFPEVPGRANITSGQEPLLWRISHIICKYNKLIKDINFKPIA